MTATPGFALDSYLGRIGCPGDWQPSVPTLRQLHRAHLGRIPFENVDVRLGRPIELGLDALQDKLVRRRRGGYCFEHNTLFAAALRAVGFEVANHYTSTHPGSVFRRTLTVQRSEPEVRHILRGVTYTMRRGNEVTRREVPEQEIPGLLRERFALDLPDEEVLAALRL